MGKSGGEIRPASLDELKAGVKAKAGHAITFLVGGLPGSAVDDSDSDGSGGGGSGDGGSGGSAGAPADASGAPAAPGSDATSAGAHLTDEGAAAASGAAEESTLVIQLFTAAGAPAADFEIELTLPDGATKLAGKTDKEGKFTAAHLPQSGNCTLQVPDIDEAAPAAVTPPPPAGRTAYAKDMALAIGTSAAIQLPPRVHRGELTGAHFETDKTFLLPTAMPGVKQLIIIYKSFGASSALVNGHTDTVGPADYNRGLSDERAASITAFLTDDVEGWFKNYQKQPHSQAWGVREDQWMLQFLTDKAGAPYYAGSIDGQAGSGTSEAYRHFQEEHDLPQSKQGDPDTRRAIIKAYMNTDGTSLPAGTKVQTHGCGLTHLKVKTGPGVANDQNRRVEIFLFDGEVSPPPQTPCPDGGCPEHAQWEGQTLNTVDLDQPLPGLEVQVKDESGAPVDGVTVHLSGPTAQDGTTAGGGKVSFAALVPGKYKAIASQDDFSAADGETEVVEGTNPPLALVLQSLAELEVTVTLADPQKSAQVTATPAGKPAIGPDVATPTTKFHRLPLGDCALSATAAFHKPKSDTAKLVRGPNQLTLALDPFGELAGKITDGTNPVAGATIQLGGASTPPAATSDGGGAYDFKELPLGDYTVSVKKAGFEEFAGKVTIKATKSTLDVALTAVTLDAFVRFEAWNLTTKAFEPVPGIGVDAVDDIALGDTVLDTRTTDASGVAHFQVFDKKRKAGEAIDLKFIAHSAGHAVGGSKLPDKWTTKGWLSADGKTQGMSRDFKGQLFGTAAAPVVFRIGVDVHLLVSYDVPPVPSPRVSIPGHFNAVTGVEVKVAGQLFALTQGELHAVVFDIEGGDDLEVEITGKIENAAVHLKKTSFGLSSSWTDVQKDNRSTSLGTQAAPHPINGTDQRAGCMHVFKVLSEWSQFLSHVNPGDWDGIDDLDITPHTISGTSYSFPVGTVHLSPDDHFDRGTIAHELSHQIMWKLSDISTAGIIGKVLAGKLHLTHATFLLTSDESHPLIEGWAEFIEAIFTGNGYNVDLLAESASDPRTISLISKPDLGEHVEGAFADGLFFNFTNQIAGLPIADSKDGNVLQPWMDDAKVQARWKSMIWEVLKDMKSADPFSTRQFFLAMKRRNPGNWHGILPNLHKFNMMMELPVIISVTPNSAAAGDTLAVLGTEFEDPGTVVQFDGKTEGPATVKSSTSLEVAMPAGPPGKVKVVVFTSAGGSLAATITRK